MPAAPDAARAAFSRWRTRLRANAFDADPHLESLLRLSGRTDLAPFRAFGARVATDLDDLARETNLDENLPRLDRFDGQGLRTEGVAFHPGYHDLGRAVYGTGVMSRYASAGDETETLALTYLYAQNGEAGHACPLACTAGMIKILQASGAAPEWLTRLLDANYDTHFHASQFLTEVQGGSDVGANAVVAQDAGDGTWRLTGEKWFCSVIDAQLFLVTARPTGAVDGTPGLMAFAVPRTLDDGTVNAFSLRRLKVKLGTRSMASAEVDFDGAVGVPVGDFRRVVRIVLNTSRLYNAIASTGMMQRAWREADAYAREREAFGRPVMAFPAVARTVSRLRVEAYAARSSTFFLARLADRIARGQATERDTLAYRMLVNLNKLWTSIAGTTAVRDAIEILGGNGAIEAFSVLPRLLRDSVVCEAWEGGHNVLCAQVLKDSLRYRVHDAMFDLLEEASGADPALAVARARWERLLRSPETAPVYVRGVAEDLRVAVQAATLRVEQASDHADPLLEVVRDDLLRTNARGYDALDDDGLTARVATLVASPGQ